MESKIHHENEVKSWLEVILKNENLSNLSVNSLGNTEKGDGYTGDILFIDAFATTINGDSIQYNFVLKCSKKSDALRASIPINLAYFNEINIYEKVLPLFNQFQLEKGIDNIFNSVPKCYGTFTSEKMEIIAFENLKKHGFVLWDRKRCLTRKHIDMVVSEYGKLHAISVAMKTQQPEKFGQITPLMKNIYEIMIKASNMLPIFEKMIIDTYDVLKNELDNHILLKWKQFKHKANYILNEMFQNMEGLKVITHGDCWNNNFLFKHQDEDLESPIKVAMLDWQLSNYTSPILDLSYFIFSCISEADLQDLESVLQCYYNSFSEFLIKLGSDPHELYPFKQFLVEWKKFCSYGILMAPGVIQACCTDKEEVIDLDEGFECGKNICEIFSIDFKDKETFKNRMRYIVKYVVEHELI